MSNMQRVPLILAVVIIILRIILEESGFTTGAINILGVNWLYFLVPIYFAVQIAQSGAEHPYKALFKQVLIFGVITRLMIAVTYVLAYQFQWSAHRFSWEGGGGVGAETAVQGMLVRPAIGFLAGIIGAVLVGMLTGSITLAIRRRSAA